MSINDDIYSRLGKVEQENAAIISTLSAIQKGMGDLSAEVKNIQRSNHTDWKTIFSGLSILVIILGGFVVLTTNPINHNIQDEAEEILRIRSWKDTMETTIPKLENDINWLEKTIDTKVADRFTGAEGRLLNKRIDRLELKHTQ